MPNIDPMIPAPQVLDGFGSFFGFHLGGLCLNSAHEFAAPEPNSLGAADRLAFCRRRLGRFAKAVSAVGEKRAIDARRAGTI